MSDAILNRPSNFSDYCYLCIRTLLLLVLSTGLSINPSFASSVRSVTGQLSLLATVENGPAFRPVMWRVKPNNPVDQKEITISRHSAIVNLEAGDYEVTAIMGDASKSSKITIKEGGKHKLVVNLQ